MRNAVWLAFEINWISGWGVADSHSCPTCNESLHHVITDSKLWEYISEIYFFPTSSSGLITGLFFYNCFLAKGRSSAVFNHRNWDLRTAASNLEAANVCALSFEQYLNWLLSFRSRIDTLKAARPRFHCCSQFENSWIESGLDFFRPSSALCWMTDEIPIISEFWIFFSQRQ